MEPIRLYRHALSGHSHRVELFLSLLGLPYQRIDVDVLKGEHKRPDFLAKNAFGQLPVIEDGAQTIADSSAILVYLALRYDAARTWYPGEPRAAAEVQRWLAAAAGPLFFGPGRLRLAAVLGMQIDRQLAEAATAQLLPVLEATLGRAPYLAGARPTIADIAMYTYIAVAPEGGVALEPYPELRAWLARIEALPHFVPMQPAPQGAR